MVGAIAALPAERCLLDGELVVFDRQGRTDFQALQAAIVDPSAPFVYVAFDLLHLDGWDLTGASLRARKEALHLLLAQRPSAALRYGDHVDGALAELLAHACELGLEGIVAKRGDAPYRSGRGKSWLKLKCLARQELVVVGFTEPKGGRGGLGALLLGVHEGERLRFAGKVGTGFPAAALVPLRAPRRARAPGARVRGAAGALPKGRDVHWVEPTLVAEVSFTGWTADGILRHPSFQGCARTSRRARWCARSRARPTPRPRPRRRGRRPRPARARPRAWPACA
ncbi:MAG: non-homologous end-joining DNA ligase [Myxococcota bacterium]